MLTVTLLYYVAAGRGQSPRDDGRKNAVTRETRGLQPCVMLMVTLLYYATAVGGHSHPVMTDEETL